MHRQVACAGREVCMLLNPPKHGLKLRLYRAILNMSVGSEAHTQNVTVVSDLTMKTDLRLTCPQFPCSF